MLKSTAGDRLRHARWSQELSIQALAKKAKVGTATIQRLERGERDITQGQAVYRLASALQIDPSDLFEAEVAS